MAYFISFLAFLLLQKLTVSVSGLVHSRINKGCQPSRRSLLCSSSRSRKSTPRQQLRSTATDYINTLSINTKAAADANQFRLDLEEAGLSHCHGILHAWGCRRMSDIGYLTPDQIMATGLDSSDCSHIYSALGDQNNDVMYGRDNSGGVRLSTTVDYTPFAHSGSFNFEVICAENDIFKGGPTNHIIFSSSRIQ